MDGWEYLVPKQTLTFDNEIECLFFSEFSFLLVLSVSFIGFIETSKTNKKKHRKKRKKKMILLSASLNFNPILENLMENIKS